MPDVPMGIPVGAAAAGIPVGVELPVADGLEARLRRAARVAEERAIRSINREARAAVMQVGQLVEEEIARKVPYALAQHVASTSGMEALTHDVEERIRRRSALVVDELTRNEVVRRSLSAALEERVDQRARAAVWTGSLAGAAAGAAVVAIAAAAFATQWRMSGPANRAGFDTRQAGSS